MEFFKLFFWVCIAVIFYNYAGYAMIAFLMTKLRKKRPAGPSDSVPYTPSVSFIVAAFNEEACIQDKINNSLEQIYPRDQIEFIFVADGSNDKTVEIIKKNPGIAVMYLPERNGKSAAINRAVNQAKNEILIFSDANTMLNEKATMKIAGHYWDQHTGGVAGEKKVSEGTGFNDPVGKQEGLYWKYESILKKIDSEFFSVVGAAGELFSIRRSLYQPLSNDIILDDFIISLEIARQGFRVIYEPGAFAVELPSATLMDEKKRKVRIAAGAFQAMWILRSLLAFWKYPKLSFLYISHRVLRWAVTPFCLPFAFLTNLWLILYNPEWVYIWAFVLQSLFYAFAVLGIFTRSNTGVFKIFKLSNYFLFMNISVIQGLFRHLAGNQPATWEKASRLQQ